MAAMPFLMASWWLPEKAVYTRSPTYGCRSGTLIRLAYSNTRRASSMSLMSSSGSTPWVNRFSAMVTTSTLPVRSPLPNRVPSTRSAPAMMPNSAAATAVPRSLWGCSDSTIESRSRMLRWKCSIMSP